ncbi:MAG: TonB family protein [Thermoanaerobaculales bacterium]
MSAPAADRVAAVIPWLMAALTANTIFAACAALVIVGLLCLLRVRSPSILYLGWSLVLVRMALPPGLSAAFSLRSFLERAWQWVSAGAAPGGGATGFGGAWIPAGLEVVPGDTASIVPWTVAAFLIWLVGSVLVATVLVRRFRWYRRIARTATPVSRPEVVAIANAWRDHFRVTRPVRVVSSDRCLTPFASGLKRPAIFLPEVMLGWSNAALGPVIAHEMAHISRLDELWTVLANVVRAAHFFNPLAWVAVARLAANRELVCDGRVLSSGQVAPDRYARSMLGAMQINLFGAARADVVLGLTDRKKGVAMRLERVRSGVRPRSLKPMTMLAGVLAALLFVLPMGANDARPGDTPAASGQEQEIAQQPEAVMEPEIVTEIDGRPVYRAVVGGPLTMPVRISGAGPEYTAEARAARVQGVVVLELTISDAGDVVDIEVLRGLPLGLTEAAKKAVWQWQFEPARLDGRPVPVLFIASVRFHLNAEEETIISGLNLAGGDKRASEELQRLRDLLTGLLERETTGDVRVSRIDVRDRQLVMSVVAPGQSSIEAFAARMRANPGLDEVQVGAIGNRENGSVEAELVLHRASPHISPRVQ